MTSFYKAWSSPTADRVDVSFKLLKEQIDLFFVQVYFLRVFGKPKGRDMREFYSRSYGRIDDTMVNLLERGVNEMFSIKKQEMTSTRFELSLLETNDSRFYELLRMPRPPTEVLEKTLGEVVKERYGKESLMQEQSSQWDFAFKSGDVDKLGAWAKRLIL